MNQQLKINQHCPKCRQGGVKVGFKPENSLVFLECTNHACDYRRYLPTEKILRMANCKELPLFEDTPPAEGEKE